MWVSDNQCQLNTVSNGCSYSVVGISGANFRSRHLLNLERQNDTRCQKKTQFLQIRRATDESAGQDRCGTFHPLIHRDSGVL